LVVRLKTPEEVCMMATSSGAALIRERRSPLITQATQGNPEALSLLLETARPVIYRWALSRTHDVDDAEDVTQLVLLRLYTRLPTFRGESRLSSWLFRVTANEISGFCRKRARERDHARRWTEAEFGTRVTRPDTDRLDREKAAGAVRDAADSLPPLQQAAFRMVDLDGMRPCEAARELGKTQTTVRSSLCRGRRKIRELVEECRRGLVQD
jgi:RNA polymerase sigma-70 factor (ECF subfamily)